MSSSDPGQQLGSLYRYQGDFFGRMLSPGLTRVTGSSEVFLLQSAYVAHHMAQTGESHGGLSGFQDSGLCIQD